ncbi:MAG: hypothetical protein AAGA55_00280 [Planctomycetota bacterium]
MIPSTVIVVIARIVGMLMDAPAAEMLMHSVQTEAMSVPTAVAEQLGHGVGMWKLL